MTDKSVVPEGMKAWAGGDGPPADWDGTNNVALRDPSEWSIVAEDWTHDGGSGDIIAYTPKPNPLSLETSDLDPITPEEDAVATAILAAVGRTRQSHDTVVRAIRDGLVKAGAVIVPGWQPIETAPRDGEWLIVYAGGFVIPACWETLSDDDGYSGWCAAGSGYGGILYSIHNRLEWEPEYWMPFSEPLSAHSIQSGGEGGAS